MVNISEAPRVATSSSMAYQGLWYVHYRLFSVAMAAYIVYCTYSWGCTKTMLLALGYMGWVVYSSLPEKKEKGAENYSAIVIGSGFSGICAGVRLNQVGVRYVVLEKAPSLGGTWLENVYPGAACDVASHLYSFSFFPNPWWTRTYSKQAEIRTYLEDVASYARVYPNIQFNSKVMTNEWNEETKMYTVTCENGKKYTANFVISGGGALHKVNIPNLKGMDTFKGPLFHSAQWDTNVDISNKRVAIIGTGASCVQILPNIADKVKSVHVFQRTPAWITPRFDGEYKTITKWIFALLPFTMTMHRYFWFWMSEMRFYLLFWKTRERFVEGITKKVTQGWYAPQVKDPETRAKLTPDYELGCKRITPSDGYLKTYNLPHVHLVTDGLESVTETGIKTKANKEYEFAIIVLATGYNILESFRAYETIGRDKPKTLADVWGEEPTVYNGTIMPNYPNMFYLLGPNTGLGHNSIIYIIECQMRYTAECIRHVIREKGKSIEVRKQPYEEWKKFLVETAKGTVWNSGCSSWYLSKNGVPWTLWPSDLTSFWWKLFTATRDEFIVA